MKRYYNVTIPTFYMRSTTFSFNTIVGAKACAIESWFKKDKETTFIVVSRIDVDELHVLETIIWKIVN